MSFLVTDILQINVRNFANCEKQQNGVEVLLSIRITTIASSCAILLINVNGPERKQTILDVKKQKKINGCSQAISLHLISHIESSIFSVRSVFSERIITRAYVCGVSVSENNNKKKFF